MLNPHLHLHENGGFFSPQQWHPDSFAILRFCLYVIFNFGSSRISVKKCGQLIFYGFVEGINNALKVMPHMASDTEKSTISGCGRSRD